MIYRCKIVREKTPSPTAERPSKGSFMSEETVELEDVSVEGETDLALLCRYYFSKNTGFQRASYMKTRKFRVRATPEQSRASAMVCRERRAGLIAMCNGAPPPELPAADLKTHSSALLYPTR